MPLPNKRNRPRVASEAIPEAPTKKRDSSLSPLDEMAEQITGSFVVVVETRGSKFRRRCYLTANAAQAAADRATDRGDTATVYLAALQPLWKIPGGGL